MHPLAFAIKAFNFVAFNAILPYECDVPDDIFFEYQGMGCAVTWNVSIGRGSRIGHHATLLGKKCRIVVEDDVTIEAHALIVGNDLGGIIRIGKGARIGAGCVVMHDVPPGAVMVPPLAQAAETPA